QKQGRAEVNDRRRREGGAGVRRSQRRPLGDERQNDELQTDQGTCSRTDDHVKAIPFGELRHVFTSSSCGPFLLAEPLETIRQFRTSLAFVTELGDEHRERLSIAGDAQSASIHWIEADAAAPASDHFLA